MTTNKPEVVAVMYRDGGVLTKRECGIAFDTCCKVETPLIRLSDYEALQAAYERLRKHLQSLIDQTTPLEPEPGNPMWSRRIQLDEVIAERDSLRAECDQLRKDAERYRWLCDKFGITRLPCAIERILSGEAYVADGKEGVDAAIDAAMQGDQP